MDTTSNLLVEDCGVDSSVREIIQKYSIDERHIEHVVDTENGKQQIIDEVEVYQAAKQWKKVNFPQFWYTVDKQKYPNIRTMPSGGLHVDNFEPKSYWQWNRSEFYYDLHFNAKCAKEIELHDITGEQIEYYFKYYLDKYTIDSNWIPFIDVKRFILLSNIFERSQQDGLCLGISPFNWAWDCWHNGIKQAEQKNISKKIKSERAERKNQLEPTQQALQSQIDELQQAENEYKALAAKWQFIFDGLLIQRQKNSTSFTLPNENNAKITAYGIIERLANKESKAFKSYRKQEIINNNNISLLPYSERLRLIFYFRQQYKMPPTLDNADTIAAFINTANKYTDNWELRQNWLACLDVTYTQEEAASLFAYYGWAANYSKEYPRTENAFYTVDVRSGERHYNIVHDDITLRFAAIERKGQTLEAFHIITDNKQKYLDKYNELQALLKPLLWWSNGVRMGLTEEARELCNTRINDYIDALLSVRAFENIPLEEQINKIEMDKSDTGIIFAQPRQFVITLNDMEFIDYQYNITAEYNRANNADKGKNKAYEKYSRLTGDEWNTNELKAQGYTPQQISNYCNKYKWIAEVPEKKIGNLKYYRRILG